MASKQAEQTARGSEPSRWGLDPWPPRSSALPSLPVSTRRADQDQVQQGSIPTSACSNGQPPPAFPPSCSFRLWCLGPHPHWLGHDPRGRPPTGAQIRWRRAGYESNSAPFISTHIGDHPHSLHPAPTFPSAPPHPQSPAAGLPPTPWA